MARLSIDLGAGSAPVPRVASPAAASGEFSRIIGGITTSEPGATPVPKKLRVALPELPKIAGQPPLLQSKPVEPDESLPVTRQDLAVGEAPEAETPDQAKPETESLTHWLVETAPPPAPTAIALTAKSPATAELPAEDATPAPGTIASPQALVSQPAPILTASETAAPAPAAVSPMPLPTVASNAPFPPRVSGDHGEPAAPQLELPHPPTAPARAAQPAEPHVAANPAPAAMALAAASPGVSKAVDEPAGPPPAQPAQSAQPTLLANQPQPVPSIPRPHVAGRQQPDPTLAIAAATVSRATRDDWRPAPAIAVESTTGLTGTTAILPGSPPVAAPAAAPAPLPAATLPLDTGRAEWIETMIDHIDELVAQGPVRTTQIRLFPDALGQVDVAIRKEGGEVHVNFTVDTAAARTLITEATPRLAELADARGLKLGGTGVETGSGGDRRADRPADEALANLMHADGEPEGPASAAHDRIA